MKKIESFDFEEGELINGKYEILELLGKGWESEVYIVKEVDTGIERAAKFFFPHRNVKGKVSKKYAKRLHKLRHCNIIMKYYTQETWFYEGEQMVVLISELIEGELLSEFLKRQPQKRLHPYVALHLLHALARGLELVHRLGEYHGDLHTDNLIVERFGLLFELKLLDVFNRSSAKRDNIQDDVVEMIHIFYEALGGKKHYHKLPEEIKDICCGLKRSLILRKFNTAGKLCAYLENMEWNS